MTRPGAVRPGIGDLSSGILYPVCVMSSVAIQFKDIDPGQGLAKINIKRNLTHEAFTISF